MAGVKQIGAIPVKSAAKRLGVSPARVYQMIEEGKLSSVKMDTTVLVYESSVEWAVAMRIGGDRDAAYSS
jgi:excisionase family DNA binding protein